MKGARCRRFPPQGVVRVWHDGDWGIGSWLAMTLVMLLFWGALLALVMWVVRGTERAPQVPDDRETVGDTALAVLERRFVRGEIDEDEFTRRRTVLLGADAGSPSPPAAGRR